jgi:hypothetical protein
MSTEPPLIATAKTKNEEENIFFSQFFANDIVGEWFAIEMAKTSRNHV